MLTAGLIFAATYLLISCQNMPGVHLHRPAAALLGAVAMVVFGVIRIDEAYRLVDFDTLVFILGMMIVIGYLEVTGFFARVETLLLEHAETPRQLLGLVVLSSGVLSALFMNDTVCLMLTPVLLRLLRRAGRSPNPYLIALATASNLGSAATPMGNPQNMIVAIHSGIPFVKFTLTLLPVSALGLWLDYLLLQRLYPAEFAENRPLRMREPAVPPVKSRLLYVCLGAVALLLGLFAADVHPPTAAIAVAALLILAGSTRPREAFRHIDWELLLMFAGLFVVMGGARTSGLLGAFLDGLAGLRTRPQGVQLAFVAASSAGVSNLVSNVPAVVFYSNVLPHLGGGQALWLALAMASTLAGNLTLIGSVANLIVFESARGEARVGFWEYFRAGAPLAAFLIAAGTLYLALIG